MSTSGRSWRNQWVSSKESCLQNYLQYLLKLFFKKSDANISSSVSLSNVTVSVSFLSNKFKTFESRLTSQTALRWSWGEMPCWKIHTDASSHLRDRNCWRHDFGWSLREKKDWTMVGWPGSGSSSCQRRCLTLTMDCSSTPPRECLFETFVSICQ